MIARTGCNAGTCHGAQAGKNGFKLSLRGYDPVYDVRALTDDLASRRVNIASPAQSLMLLKPTAAVPHTGGQVFKPAACITSASRMDCSRRATQFNVAARYLDQGNAKQSGHRNNRCPPAGSRSRDLH